MTCVPDARLGGIARRLLRSGPLAAAALVCAVAAPGAAAAGCPNANRQLGEITIKQARAATFCLINKQRTSRGLVALKENDALRKAARLHSQDMVAHHYFSHVDQSGGHSWDRARAAGYTTGYKSWYVTENIYWGSQSKGTPAAAVSWWMGSDVHRHNILLAKLRDIGIGIAAGAPKQGASNAATYTTDFGVRS